MNKLLCVSLLLCGSVLPSVGWSAEENAAPLPLVDIRKLPLDEALRALSQSSGLNLVTTPAAAKIEVSLYLRNMPAKAVLEELSRSNNLGMERDAATGVYRFATLEEVRRDMGRTPQESTEIIQLLYPNAVDVAVAIRNLYGDRVRLQLGQEPDSDMRQELESRLDRFDMIDQRSQGLFQSGSSTGSSSGGGGGSSSGNGTTGSTFRSTGTGGGTTQNFNSQRSVAAVDSELAASNAAAQRPVSAQETALIQAIQKAENATEREALLERFHGRATIFLTVERKNNLLIIRTSGKAALEEIHALVKRMDVPTPLVLLEVKLLSIDLTDGFNSVFDFQFTDGINNAGGFTSGNILPPLADALSPLARRTAALNPAGTGLQNGALTFQFVNNNFRARLQALEDRNRVTTLATPVVLTANNEVSRLFVGEERPIVRNVSSQTVVNNGQTVTTPTTTIEFRPVGTTLLMTPNINADRTVTIRLLQESSTITASAASIPVVSANGAVQNVPVDVVGTRSVSGTIVAKDGLMVAIGGLIEESAQDTRSQVPFLGKIPGLGILFRQQSNRRTRRELIILVRPYVFSTPTESSEGSQNLLKELSIHPSAPEGKGTLKAFTPNEVVKPNPPKTRIDSIFRSNPVKQEEDY